MLLALRGLDLLRAVLFAAVVPRLLGPEEFGRFNVLTSVALAFALLSGLGSTQLMGRFVPALRHAGDEEGIARLFAGLLVLRSATGLVSAILLALALGHWLSELPAPAIVLTAVAVALRAPANTPFALWLGLDQADRWGVGDALRRWSSLVLLLPLAWSHGLVGALVALTLAELLVLGLGLAWARPWLRGFALPSRAEWRPYARYNALFLASNALFVVVLHGTSLLIRAVSGGYEQVAWFAAAHAAYLALHAALWQLCMAFAPLLSGLRAAGRHEAVREAAERLLRGLGVAGVGVTLAATLGGGALVRFVVGPAFAPAAPLLPPLALALLAAAAGQVGRVLALTFERPRTALGAALVQAAVLTLAGPPLVHALGALGGALVTLAATSLAAMFWAVRLRDVAPGYWRGLGRVIGLGLPFFAAAAFADSTGAMPRLPVLVVLLAGYGAGLLATRTLTPGDVRALRDALRDPSARAAVAAPTAGP